MGRAKPPLGQGLGVGVVHPEHSQAGTRTELSSPVILIRFQSDNRVEQPGPQGSQKSSGARAAAGRAPSRTGSERVSFSAPLSASSLPPPHPPVLIWAL